MSEAKDPKIKLFGKTIQLPETHTVAAMGVETAEEAATDCVQSSDVADDDSPVQDRPCLSDTVPEDRSLNTDAAEQESTKDLSGKKQENNDVNDGEQLLIPGESKDANLTLTNDNPKTQFSDNGAETLETSKTKDNPSETITSQEKTLKKPDKILPCPRCTSMDTKFCYFNNYNVNQPRHFCKKCQRYWTAGGTIRNVPVGAGRRKNKNAAAHFRHLAVPEAPQNARVDLPSGIHRLTLNPNGNVHAFKSDTPLCESIASGLSIADETSQNCSRNDSYEPKEIGISDSCGYTDNRNDYMSISSGASFPYPWNSIQWSAPVSPSTYGSNSFPMLFYPTAPYWGCVVPGSWNVSWLVSLTASNNHTPSGSGPDSLILGKHSRDDSMLNPATGDTQETQKQSNSDKCLWVPKTLRINDPGEAARSSSICASFGTKKESVVGSVGGRGLFKAFRKQSKDDEKTQVPETSTVLQANPAALSRSLNFHESS